MTKAIASSRRCLSHASDFGLASLNCPVRTQTDPCPSDGQWHRWARVRQSIAGRLHTAPPNVDPVMIVMPADGVLPSHSLAVPDLHGESLRSVGHAAALALRPAVPDRCLSTCPPSPVTPWPMHAHAHCRHCAAIRPCRSMSLRCRLFRRDSTAVRSTARSLSRQQRTHSLTLQPEICPAMGCLGL